MEYSLDPFLFNKLFKAFSSHVKSQSNIDNLSFVSNPYLEEREFYKYEVYNQGRKKLNFKSWEKSDIGNGKIGRAVISAIEFEENNLVNWHPRYGESALAHYDLKKAIDSNEKLSKYESVFYELYLSNNDEKVFSDLINLFGKRYPLIAYLFFLKDRNRFMPIAPSYFDKGFNLLGIDFKTSHKCSWSNYLTYNGILNEIKKILEELINSDVSLLDSHSFLWISARKFGNESDFLEKEDYDKLTQKEREVVTKARIGQGRFRELLINQWKNCAVTGCSNKSLLIASHIKPWRECSIEEAIDRYNGILLSPAIDSAFDLGLISFENSGQILISKSFSKSDAISLGINPELKINNFKDKHKKYLAYHRTNIFMTES